MGHYFSQHHHNSYFLFVVSFQHLQRYIFFLVFSSAFSCFGKEMKDLFFSSVISTNSYCCRFFVTFLIFVHLNFFSLTACFCRLALDLYFRLHWMMIQACESEILIHFLGNAKHRQSSIILFIYVIISYSFCIYRVIKSRCESQTCPMDLITPPDDCHVNNTLSFSLQVRHKFIFLY